MRFLIVMAMIGLFFMSSICGFLTFVFLGQGQLGVIVGVTTAAIVATLMVQKLFRRLDEIDFSWGSK